MRLTSGHCSCNGQIASNTALASAMAAARQKFPSPHGCANHDGLHSRKFGHGQA